MSMARTEMLVSFHIWKIKLIHKVEPNKFNWLKSHKTWHTQREYYFLFQKPFVTFVYIIYTLTANLHIVCFEVLIRPDAIKQQNQVIDSEEMKMDKDKNWIFLSWSTLKKSLKSTSLLLLYFFDPYLSITNCFIKMVKSFETSLVPFSFLSLFLSSLRIFFQCFVLQKKFTLILLLSSFF